MPPNDDLHEIESLRDHLAVLRRRKLALLFCLLAGPAIALAISLSLSPRYEASAEVLLNRQNVATSLTGGGNDSAAYNQAARIAQTQANLARVPTVAKRTLDAVGLQDRSVRDFLDSSSVDPERNADLLTFTVRDGDAALARRLANEYARQFSIYRRELDTASLRQARREVEARITELRQDGVGLPVPAGSQGASPASELPQADVQTIKTRLYASLLAKAQQLRTTEALQRSNALVVQSATDADRVRPQPIRDGLIGLGLGLLLGIAFAFVREGVDTRVRSAEEIRERLGVPLLARLKEPTRRYRKGNKLVTVEDPNGDGAEAFRVLRTNLDFVNLAHGARTIMVSSAVGSEGTSTTAANLAVALARSGRRTILVDLNVKRPQLHRFFPSRPGPGVSDVVLGYGQLKNALMPVSVVSESANGSNGERGGGLAVVSAGRAEPEDGELIGSRSIAQLLEDLRERCDVVVIDAPPLLQGGGGLALSAGVDGLILVTRLKVLRRPMLRELARVLEACPTAKLGFVLTGAESDDTYPLAFSERKNGFHAATAKELTR